jgi:hypothetical protein
MYRGFHEKFRKYLSKVVKRKQTHMYMSLSFLTYKEIRRRKKDDNLYLQPYDIGLIAVLVISLSSDLLQTLL